MTGKQECRCKIIIGYIILKSNRQAVNRSPAVQRKHKLFKYPSVRFTNPQIQLQFAYLRVNNTQTDLVFNSNKEIKHQKVLTLKRSQLLSPTTHTHKDTQTSDMDYTKANRSDKVEKLNNLNSITIT